GRPTGTRREAEIVDMPAEKRLLPDHRPIDGANQLFGQFTRSPALARLLARSRRSRHVGRGSVRVIENQGPRTLRIRRREQRAKLAALDGAKQRSTLRTGRIEDSTDVVHLRLERQDTRPVGKPGAALVEQDQTRERCKPLEETSEQRLLP